MKPEEFERQLREASIVELERMHAANFNEHKRGEIARQLQVRRAEAAHEEQARRHGIEERSVIATETQASYARYAFAVSVVALLMSALALYNSWS